MLPYWPDELIEAAVRGLPTVVSDRGGLPETAEATVFRASDPAALLDALQRLAGDPVLLEAKSRRLLETRERFLWANHMSEVEGSKFNFDQSDPELLARHFEDWEKESIRMNSLGLVIPSYEFCLKCSHLFNLLDARGAISVTERTKYIARVRHLAKLAAEAYYRQREELGFPLLRNQK